MLVQIVVLNDGETYSQLKGCRILTVTDEGAEALDCGVTPDDLRRDQILSEVILS